MKPLVIATLCLSIILPSTAAALTVPEAQNCVDELIKAYEEKRFPTKMLDTDRIIQTAIGRASLSMSTEDHTYARDLALTKIVESFTEPSGKYTYENVKVLKVATARQGYRVTGTLYLTSPRYNGESDFLALTTAGCRVYQVRILEIEALIERIRIEIGSDSRLKRYFR